MILVTGATGTLGSEVVAALRRADVPVRALTRSPRQAQTPPDVDVAEGDLDQPDTVTTALSGVSAVFLLAGFADMPALLARTAAAGVRRVVLLSSGAVVGGEVSNAITRYHLDSEAAVRASGMPWVILRPSGFMTNALRWRAQLQAGDVVRAPFPTVAVTAVDPADIAAVAARCLTEAGHDGAHYRLTGPAPLHPADQVQILGQVLRRPLLYLPQTNEEAYAEMATAMPTAYVDAFFRYYADGTYDDSVVHNTIPELLNRRARTFSDWATAHAGDFDPSHGYQSEPTAAGR